jgi:hypothetical protein
MLISINIKILKICKQENINSTIHLLVVLQNDVTWKIQLQSHKNKHLFTK